jgi:hypothetical protein
LLCNKLNLIKVGSLPYLVFLTAGAAFADPSPSLTQDVRPLYSFNQSPLIQIYGLPAVGAARVLPQDESTLELHLQIANNFTGTQSSSEYLNLDGETHRLTVAWRQGLPTGWEWGLEVPYLSHSGGFLDSSIERFHQITGLPQGGRTDTARNQINYRYIRNGVDLIDVNHFVNGLGDVRVLAAKQISDDGPTDGLATALRASLKLPTGDHTELLGSGSTDLAVWLSAATAFRPDAWNTYGGGGILLMSAGKVLPSQQRNQVGFGTLGFSRQYFPHVALNAQLDAHSSFYDHTSLRQLNHYAIQGLAGLNWELASRTFLEFSISEDLIVNTSPDVVFSLSLYLPF